MRRYYNCTSSLPVRYVFFSPERWQSIGIFPPPSPSHERTASRRSRETSKFASLKNSEMIFGNKETPGTRLDAFLTCSDAIWKHRGATRHHIPIDRVRHTRTSCSCGLQEIPSLILYGGASALNFCTDSLPLPRQFTHYVRSSTCGERDLLSYIVMIPI